MNNLVKPCGICSLYEHATNSFPSLQDGNFEQAHLVGHQRRPPAFNRPQVPSRPNFDPYALTYNIGCETTPILLMEINTKPTHLYPLIGHQGLTTVGNNIFKPPPRNLNLPLLLPIPLLRTW